MATTAILRGEPVVKEGKRTYAELLRDCHKLEAKLKEANRAMAQADRALVGYHVDRWVSVPLPVVQCEAIKEQIWEMIAQRHGEGRLRSNADGCERWEMTIDADDFLDGKPLAEWQAYHVSYFYDREEGITVSKIWALVPV